MNYVLFIIAFNLAVYFRALRCTVIVDDVRWYKMWQDQEKSDIKYPMTWRDIPKRLYGGGTFGTMWVKRVGPFLLNAIEFDHLVGIILHTISCLLMFAVLGANEISFFGSLLYASCSTTMHTTVWLNGRRYSVNIILTLLMVGLSNMNGWWSLLCYPLYAATASFHFTAFFSPVMFNNPWITIAFMSIFFFTFRQRIIEGIKSKLDQIASPEKKGFKPQRIIIVIKSFGWYFFKMIFPGMTRVIYGKFYFWGETPEGNKNAYAINTDLFKGAMAILICAVVFLLLPNAQKAMWIFMALGTLQWSAIVSASQVLADRYINLPNIFMQFFIAMAAFHFFPVYAVTILVAMIAVNVACLQLSFPMFQGIQKMYDYHFFHQPEVVGINREYISWMIRTGDYIKAWTMTKECLRYNPHDFALLHSTAICSKMAGDRKSARAAAELAGKHLYFGQEEQQEKWIQNFIRTL